MPFPTKPLDNQHEVEERGKFDGLDYQSCSRIEVPRRSSAGKFGVFRHIMMLSLDGERRTEPLLQTPFAERNAQLWHDGKWLAYESNESGVDEVYVRRRS